ncbi:MAG: HD domain-containing protein, partial [Nitrospirae bacterium]
NTSVDEIVDTYELNYNEAETLYPASVNFLVFFEAFSFDKILIPLTSMRHGMILDLINMLFGEGIDIDFSQQIIHSAIELGRKYRMDEAHAMHVARLSLSIFDKLRELHGLKAHDRFLLEVAAILHDVGSFINEAKHHLHSFYLVSNSELIGLKKNDLDIIANLVKYHRVNKPGLSDESFLLLDSDSRVKVYKLSAILRVADALDRSHNQVIDDFDLKINGDRLLITPSNKGVYEYEKLAIRDKSDLFDSVFGLEVVLR